MKFIPSIPPSETYAQQLFRLAQEPPSRTYSIKLQILGSRKDIAVEAFHHYSQRHNAMDFRKLPARTKVCTTSERQPRAFGSGESELCAIGALAVPQETTRPGCVNMVAVV